MPDKKSESKEKEMPKNVYSKFINFLNSPIWALPIMAFVEQRSIVFDREQGDPKMFKQIHKEFTAIVDTLIGSFCEDADIRPEELSNCLRISEKGNKLSQRDKVLIEPVIAAQDFDVFIPMMTRKNIELQLEALQMIEFMCGLVPAVLKINEDAKEGEKKADKKGKKVLDQDEHDRIILIQVLNQSKEEFEKDQANREEAQRQLEAAVKESLRDKERLEAARAMEQANIQSALQQQTPVDKEQVATEGEHRPAKKTVRPVSAKNNKERPKSRTRSNETKAQKIQITKMKEEKGEEEEEEVEKRAIYLRQQRDKLLEMKRQARERAFEQQEKASKLQRPKTAKAAKDVMRGRVSSKVNEDVLAARRALAQKLKSEVMSIHN